MRLIDIDKLSLYYGGLIHISPYDFEGTAKYFAKQVKAAPVVEAIPCDFIHKLKTDPDNAGSKSRVLSWLSNEWEEYKKQQEKTAVKTCAYCDELDHSTMYCSDPPQYKCEKYGCIRRITDTCKNETGE